MRKKTSVGTRYLALAGALLGVATSAWSQSLPRGPQEEALRIGTEFAERLALALSGEPEDWDRLWYAGARDSTRRILDIRTSSLFDWTDVGVAVGACRFPEYGVFDRVRVELVTTGTATWDPNAFGVAEAFWALQLDENAPSNRVCRREFWTLGKQDGEWLVVSRERLAPFEIVNARVGVGVYPGQDALLLECTYYVRSLVEGARVARFLLDRRARIYDLEADGVRIELARGGELGSLGLEGYSPELESSLRFEEPLALGEESLIKFRILAPLVHLTGEGFVTTLPIHEGAFRERVWIPIFPGAGSETSIELEIRWPSGKFGEVALGGHFDGSTGGAQAENHLEETVVILQGKEDLRLVDLLLAREGTRLESLGAFALFAGENGRAEVRTRVPMAVSGSAADVALYGLVRPDAERAPAAIRSRERLIAPMLDTATYSSRDLASEVDELLPLDSDLLDLINELFDESGEAEDGGAQDRSPE